MRGFRTCSFDCRRVHSLTMAYGSRRPLKSRTAGFPGCRVGEDVATLTPHRTGRAEFPLTGSSRESFAHSGVARTPSVTRLSRNALASSAIRCRFVDRFARPKVLSHVSRQRFSPRDAPLSSIGSRRDQFSDVVSTMRALRLPTPASPVTYLLRFRGPRDSSLLRAR